MKTPTDDSANRSPLCVNRRDSTDATARAQIEMLGAALDAYRLENGRYPTAEQGSLHFGATLASNWEVGSTTIYRRHRTQRQYAEWKGASSKH